MKKKALVLLVGLLAASAVFAGCGVSQTTQTATDGTAQTEQQEKKENLEVLEHSVVHDGYLSYIVGKVKNNTNKTYSYVQVSINLYKGCLLYTSLHLYQPTSPSTGAIGSIKL